MNNVIKKLKNGRGYICELRCIVCGKKWKMKASALRYRKGKYCSYDCRNIGFKQQLKGKNNPNWKGGLVTLNCLYCKKDYQVKRKDVKNSRYCSKECMNNDLPRIIKERYERNPKLKDKTKNIGIKNGNYGKSAAHGKGEYYKNVWMRSTWEIKFAKWLDKNNLAWKYEPKRFILKDRTYAPDFYIKDWDKWIEIKGWYHERHQETVKQFKNIYLNEELIVLGQKELNDLGIKLG